MEIDIPGNVDDYFSRIESEELGIQYKGNRSRIRAVVALRNAALQNVISSGGNIHTANLELNDQFSEFISTAPVLAQSEILNIFAEELMASAATMNDETIKINAATAAEEEKNHLMAQAFFVVVIIFIAAIVITSM